MSSGGVSSALGALQPLGRALMLPIAVLPVAGLLLRLGQPDLLNIPFVAAAGDAIFHNLGLLFAIGVAVGFATRRQRRGGPGRRGLLPGRRQRRPGADDRPAGRHSPASPARRPIWPTAAFKANAIYRLSVPLGILSGVIAGGFYNRFGAIKLPEYLAFFGGRRFVPIVSGLAGLVLARRVRRSAGAAISGGIDALQPRHRRGRPARPLRLRRAEPAADRHRPAPHPQQRRLVHRRRLPRRHRRPQPLLRRRSHRRRVHERLLPGDDVRPAGGVPGDVAQRPAGAARGGRRHAGFAGADLVPDRRHRADRVQLHVPGAGALRPARGADRRCRWW